MAVDLSKFKKHEKYKEDWGVQIAPVSNNAKREVNTNIASDVQARNNIMLNRNASIADVMQSGGRMIAPVSSNSVAKGILGVNENRILAPSNEIQKMVNVSNQVSKKSSDIGYVAKKSGAGLLSGLTGLAQAKTTDLANNLKEGKEKFKKNKQENNIAKKALNTVMDSSSLGTLMNPTNHVINSAIDGVKNMANILRDDEKTPLEKAVEVGTNAVSGALDMVSPFRQIAKPTEQAIRGSVAR